MTVAILLAPLRNTSAEICIVTFPSTEVGFGKWPGRIIVGVASQLRQSLLILVSSRGRDEPSKEHMTRSAAKVAVGGGGQETLGEPGKGVGRRGQRCETEGGFGYGAPERCTKCEWPRAGV